MIKKALKLVGKIVLLLVGLPVVYLLVSLLFTIIPISEKHTDNPKAHTIYLTTNGVHADVVLPKKLVTPAILKDQVIRSGDAYFAFGWGEENFYLNTPTWGDLKFSTAFRAAFLKSKTLLHITRYRNPQSKWIAVQVTEEQLKKLTNYIQQSFDETSGKKILLKGAAYTQGRDNFYRAKGNYMYHHTCNSWLNRGLKESGLKGSLWTPFDFGVMRWYE